MFLPLLRRRWVGGQGARRLARHIHRRADEARTARAEIPRRKPDFTGANAISGYSPLDPNRQLALLGGMFAGPRKAGLDIPETAAL